MLCTNGITATTKWHYPNLGNGGRVCLFAVTAIQARAATQTITNMKTAVIIISDPKAGEEALARVFNALAVAAEGSQAGDEVEVSFIGTGTRWPAELSKLTSPVNALYNEVRGLVVGASCACAAVFGATESVQACGIKEKKDNVLNGTPGLLSLRHDLADGWNVLIF